MGKVSDIGLKPARNGLGVQRRFVGPSECERCRRLFLTFSPPRGTIEDIQTADSSAGMTRVRQFRASRSWYAVRTAYNRTPLQTPEEMPVPSHLYRTEPAPVLLGRSRLPGSHQRKASG